MTSNTIIKLIISIAIPLAIGAVAGMFTASAVPEWFASLNRPSFAPPNWVFGPVWTTLYVIMGISMFLIWKMPASNERSVALLVYSVQLMLNFGWSFFFFYFKTLGIALIEIIILWISIAAMLLLFYKLKPMAAYINIPYFLWVTFASFLNGGFYKLN